MCLRPQNHIHSKLNQLCLALSTKRCKNAPCPLNSDTYSYTRYIACRLGWGVGWQQSCKTRQPLCELDNKGTVFLFFFWFAVAMAARSSYDHLCGVDNLKADQGE